MNDFYYKEGEPKFNLEEQKFISKLIPGLNFENLSEDDYYLIEEKVGEEYGMLCLDDPIQDLDKCYLCERILDKLAGDI